MADPSLEQPFLGTTAVVTGASSGIGRRTALQLGQLGASTVVVHYCTNLSGAEETVAMLTKMGVNAFVMPADLAQPVQISSFVHGVFQRVGEVHTWINNAGLDVLTGEIASAGFDEKLRMLLEIDVMGTIALSRLAVDQMLRQDNSKPASMTFIGWDQAPHGMEGDAGQMFGPVKAAVMAYSASLAQSVAPNMRVNTVAPGWIRTAWGETQSGGDYWDSRAKSQSMRARWGNPADVAQAIAFVANPNHDFINGQVIEVNGGWNRSYLRNE